MLRHHRMLASLALVALFGASCAGAPERATGRDEDASDARQEVVQAPSAPTSPASEEPTAAEPTTAEPTAEPRDPEEKAERVELEPVDEVRPSEWVIGARRPEVFLTFDGHPGDDAVPQVLEALGDHGAPGAFFLPGWWIRENIESARAIVDQGHVLGNRAMTGDRLPQVGDRRLRRSIRRAGEWVAAAGGDPRPFFRAPGGKRGRRIVAEAASQGYRTVGWTYRPAGGAHDAITDRVLGRAREGSILTLSLWRPSHVRALPAILEGLDEEGLAPVRLQELRRARPVAWDTELRRGSSGPLVRNIQRRLADATYPVGPADGSFGEKTEHAVVAFQKVHRVAPTGELGPRAMARIAASTSPPAPEGGGNYVYVDIDRQVLFEVRRGQVVNTFPVSSGSGEPYTVEGETHIARTPTGEYGVTRKISGWRESRLGRLYYPVYYLRGFAIHGYHSVPTEPASAGCVRIPMHVAEDFHHRMDVGHRIIVR